MKYKTPELALLRALLLVSESPSIEEAAKQLSITQSALSYQLKRLQEGLSSPVFSSEGRRKVLTHFGRALCEFARQETSRLEQGMEALERAYADPTHLTLRVACRRDRFVQVRSCLEFPGSIEFLASSSDEALARLRAHEVDIAVCHARPGAAGLVARPLFSSGPWLICHPKWLAGRKRGEVKATKEMKEIKDPKEPGGQWARDPKFLEETPLLTYQQDEAFITRWWSLCGAEPARARIRVVCEDWGALIAWAMQGEGYALVPGDLVGAAIKRFGSQDLVTFAVPAPEIPPMAFYAVFHRDLRKTPGLGTALQIREA